MKIIMVTIIKGYTSKMWDQKHKMRERKNKNAELQKGSNLVATNFIK